MNHIFHLGICFRYIHQCRHARFHGEGASEENISAVDEITVHSPGCCHEESLHSFFTPSHTDTVVSFPSDLIIIYSQVSKFKQQIVWKRTLYPTQNKSFSAGHLRSHLDMMSGRETEDIIVLLLSAKGLSSSVSCVM